MNNPFFALHAQFNPVFRRVSGVFGGKYAPTAGFTDSATVYVDIQVTSSDAADFVDSATVYVDIQPASTEAAQFVDSATVLAVSYTHLRAHETPEHLVCR